MATTLPPGAVQQKQFTTPRAAIRAVSLPIERRAEYGTLEVMLGCHRSEVRRMMLNAANRKTRCLGEPGRAIIRVQIADDHFWGDTELRQHA